MESLTAELDTARADLAHATQVHGGALYAEQDSTAEALAAQQAWHRVAALEAAVVIAIQKDDAAQADLQQAEHQAVVAADDEANQELKDSVLELEALMFVELKPAVDKFAKARLVVRDRSASDTATASAIRDFDLWFPKYLHRYCAALIPGSDSYDPAIDKEGKHLVAWSDAISYSMNRRRRG